MGVRRLASPTGFFITICKTKYGHGGDHVFLCLMATQHFCQFLKQRGSRRNVTGNVNQQRSCMACDTRLSRYNGEDTCFSCQEKLRDRWLGEEGKLAIVEEGRDTEINFSGKNLQRGREVQITLWRECRDICKGNGQTVFGVVDPIARIIRLEQTKTISHDGKCGACGGEVRLFRNLVPRWAENFRVRIRGIGIQNNPAI